MKPIAFMVMPFGRKKPTVSGAGIPAEIDFDALWHEVHKPVLEGLGYVAIRADEDVGAIIVREMICRLAAADAVVADVSLANSNVYYEVGLRHAAKRTHCALVAADWAERVFDLDQIRRVRYPLADGDLKAPGAVAAARAVLEEGVPDLLDGHSPFYEAVPDFPDVKPEAFANYVAQMSDFGTAVRTIRLTADRDRRAELTRELLARHGDRRAVQESVVLELIRLVRDHLTWSDVLAYVDSLPAALRRHPAVEEQRQLALSGTGRVEESAAALEELIERCGATSERLGLLGGRYKRLFREAGTPSARRRFRDRAIAAYERGMLADLNDYYPSSNLPRLYRRRGGTNDERRAQEALAVAVVACRASAERRPDDQWAGPTLLAAAFDTGDPAEARAVLDQMCRDDIPAWMIRSTSDDLAESLTLLPPSQARDELEDILAEVRTRAEE